MSRPTKRLILAALLIPICVGASSKRIIGTIHPTLPKYELEVAERDSDEVDGARRVTQIRILSGGRLVQTVAYPDDDDAPVDFGPGEIASFEDVDCDGYKDLLVRRSIGVHGDAWFYLYRFDVSTRTFVEYAPFSDLAYESVSCKTRIVKTYVNSGAAGCIYEAGWYKWTKNVLEPVRVESQDLAGEMFLRTIRIKQSGKLVVQSEQKIPRDGCHSTKVVGTTPSN